MSKDPLLELVASPEEIELIKIKEKRTAAKVNYDKGGFGKVGSKAARERLSKYLEYLRNKRL